MESATSSLPISDYSDTEIESASSDLDVHTAERYTDIWWKVHSLELISLPGTHRMDWVKSHM